MKKYLAMALVIIPLLSGINGIYDFLYDTSKYRMLMGVGLILAGVICCSYKFIKKEQTAFNLVINFATLLCISLGYMVLTQNYTVGAILLVLSCISIIAKEIIYKNFKFNTCLISLAVIVPTILTICIADFYGFNSVLSQILNLIYLCFVCVVLAISIEKLLKKTSLTSAFGLSFGIIFYALNFLIVLNKYSNLSRYYGYIITALFVVSTILLLLSNLFSKEQVEQVENAKKGLFIKGIIAVFLASIIVCSSFTGVLATFNIAGPKMSKAQFLQAVGKDFNLPIIEINTENNQLPKTKEDYLNCSFSITNCQNEDHNFFVAMKGSYEDEGSVGIRLRGNSTKLLKKQPFRIKFDKKQSLLGLKKNKSWVLLADYLDPSYIKNYTAFTLAKEFDELDFSPTPNHVALIINGEFKGLYLLCEQIDENSGRVDIKKDILSASEYNSLSAEDKEDAINVEDATEFPFLVEMDRNAHLEGTTGVDNFKVQDFYPVEIKYPESDERCRTKNSDKVYDYINEYINAVFTTLKTGESVSVSFRSSPVSFTDLVDVDSLVDYYLVNEIMHNRDNAWGSIYLHKEQNEKLKFGPVWDFDWSMSNTFDGGESLSEIECAKELTLLKKSKIYSLAFKNEQIFERLQQRFNYKKEIIIDTIYIVGEYKKNIEKIAKLDAKMWHGKSSGLEYDYARLFLFDRYQYMDSVYNLTYQQFISTMNI